MADEVVIDASVFAAALFDEEHSAAAKIAHHVQRRCWLLIFACKMRECTSKCDVVDVVTCCICIHAFLTPARHTTEHQSRVTSQADVWAHA